ncbi:MAG: peptidase, partial [Bacteroidota bacterium]
GSSFALFCKNEGITLVGEETGGGYYTQTGGYPVIYTLPNSKIKILIPFVKINRFVNDKTVKKGSGILPDKEVHLAVQDLIQGRDAQLHYILELLKKK